MQRVILLALVCLPARTAVIDTQAMITTVEGVQTCSGINPCFVATNRAMAVAQTSTVSAPWGNTLLNVSAYAQAGTVADSGPGAFTNLATAEASIRNDLDLLAPGTGLGFIEADFYAFHQSWRDTPGILGTGSMTVFLGETAFAVPLLSLPGPPDTPLLTYRASLMLGQPFIVGLTSAAWASAAGAENAVAHSSLGLAALRFYDARGILIDSQRSDAVAESPEPSAMMLSGFGLAALIWRLRRRKI